MYYVHHSIVGILFIVFSSSICFGIEPGDFVTNQLKIENFKQNIQDLSDFGTRHWQQPENAMAIDLIKQRLESYGYTNVTMDPYMFMGQLQHNVYATKIGTVQPLDMYIISAHMDSMNFADFTNAGGADDDGSGTALVLELARVFAGVETDVSIRFALWNNEETGLDGSEAYVANHRMLQGTANEPNWLGVIQHDMILYDHSAVPDADIEYDATRTFGGGAITLANFLGGAMARYGTMPAEVTDNMCCTDSVSFFAFAPAISVRENRRLLEIGNGSNPNYHQPTDVYSTYSDADFEFGFNIVKMTGGALAELTNARPAAPALPTAAEDLMTKDRYITFDASGSATNDVAYRVTRVAGGSAWYTDCSNVVDGGSEGQLVGLSQTPAFCDWSASPVLHVHGCEVVPGNEYAVEAMYDASTVTAAISLNTTAPEIGASRQFGDSVGIFNGGMWSAPDGLVSANDIVAVVKKFSDASGPPHRARVDADGKDVNTLVASNDILRAVRGFAADDFGFGVTDCLTGVCVPNCP